MTKDTRQEGRNINCWSGTGKVENDKGKKRWQ